MSSTDLILGNDELHGISIVRIRNRVRQQTNRTNNFPDTMDFSREIRRIANDCFRSGDLAIGFDSHGNTILIDNLLDFLIQHVRSAENRGQSVVSVCLLCIGMLGTWRNLGAVLLDRREDRCKETFRSGPWS